MIILNQDRTGIINFDNVMCIEVVDMEEDGYSVTAEVVVGTDDIYKELGYYKTEERAKEVLKEICREYIKYLKLKGGPAILQGQMDVQPNIFNIPKGYKMPKE